MRKEKKFNVILAIAVIADIAIFVSLLYGINNLSKQLVETNGKIVSLENKILQQESQVHDVDTKVSNMIAEEEKEKKQLEEENDPNTIAVKNLDKSIFVVDFENYNPENDEVKISKERAKEIAQYGFEESKKRIASEGTDDVDSETIKIDEVDMNNYFTRYGRQSSELYGKRKCYIVNRENEMGNGIYLYVDVTTGLIVGGGAYGD